MSIRIGGLAAMALAILAAPARHDTSRFQNPAVMRQLRIAGFTLGRSTFDEVRSKLGPTEARRCSREEEAPIEICYLSDSAILVLRSGFSGGWNQLDEYVVISPQAKNPCPRQCPRPAAPIEPIQTDGGLRLGLTRQEVVHLLGRPAKEVGDRLEYSWQLTVPVSPEDRAKSSMLAGAIEWSVDDRIRVILAHGKVVKFSMEHLVTD